MSEYDWITTQDSPAVTDNQWPTYAKPLFERWTKEGWEIVSVTVFPPPSNMWMCNAIGVLRKPKAAQPVSAQSDS